MIQRLGAACVAFMFALQVVSVAYAQDLPAEGECIPGNCPVLKLEAFLNQVLRSSPAARLLRLEDDRALAALLDARGGFDPYLTSGYEYKTQGDKDKLNVLQSGVTLPFDLPTSPSLTLDYRRGLGSSIDPSVLTSRLGETRFGVSLSPLQGLTTNKRRASLNKARLEPRRADALQAQGRNRLLLDATRAFWAWVEARRILQINRELMALATRRRDLVTRQARAGETAAVDSVEAELAVVSREGKVAAARRKADQARVKLSVYIWNGDETERPARYDPPPLPTRPVVADSAAAVATALSRRPELREIALKEHQVQIEQRLARERLRPDLKLEAQVVSYDESPFDVNDVKLGFKINQPLFFRSGRGATERTQIEAQALRFKQELTRRKVQADVEAALVALRQSQRRVSAAERRVELARRLQEAERRRFELGESTLFLVNQREQAFAEAREERVAAQIDVVQAHATVRWATGTISDRFEASSQ